MDIFDSVYYNACKHLHQFRGSWPYQTRGNKLILRLIVVLSFTSVLVPQVVLLVNAGNDLEVIINVVPNFVIVVYHIAEYLTYMVYGDQMLQLFNTIKEDWDIYSRSEYHGIIQKYSEAGRKIAWGYAVSFVIITSTFMMTTLLPRIMDILHPLNESRTLIYLIPSQYISNNQDRYYVFIFIHQAICCTAMVASIVATDTTYCIFAHHVCGMFAIVRLSNLQHTEEHKVKLTHRTFLHEEIADCIEKHKRAMWFCDTMESAHAKLLFMILLTSVVALSVTGVQAMSHPSEISETLRSAALCTGQILHIYYYCWNSQKIVDHSSAVFDAIYDAEWYKFLTSTTKLLRFIMLRTTKPCVQTAAKIFPMTLMNFTVIIKTSMSYLTVLRNAQ